MKTKTSKKTVKTAKRVVVKVSPNAKVTFVSKRPGAATAPKSVLLALVPRKGSISVSALTAKAKAAELKLDRVPGWIASLAKYNRIELH
jgi:hypothetical protein